MAECRQCTYARNERWREANPEKHRARVARWRAEHPDRAAELNRLWNMANPEKVRSKNRRYTAKHPGRNTASVAAYYRTNPHKATAKAARYKARQVLATPAWANKRYIEDTYLQADIRTRRDGVPWHVDHIVPLKSPLVCGLHWEENLQVIPGAENNRKGNRYWPEMPGVAHV